MTHCGIIFIFSYICLYNRYMLDTYSWSANGPESLNCEADSEKNGGGEADTGERVEQPVEESEAREVNEDNLVDFTYLS